MLSAAAISVAMAFYALMLEASRGAHVKASMEQAAHFATKAGAIAWKAYDGDEYQTIRVAKKYYNANITGNLPAIRETNITVNNLARKIEIRADKNVPSLSNFLSDQQVTILVESPY